MIRDRSPQAYNQHTHRTSSRDAERPPPVSSQILAVQPGATLPPFLRERQTSYDRKRRHTGNEHERRQELPHASAAAGFHRSRMNNDGPNSGRSRESAIDLTSPTGPLLGPARVVGETSNQMANATPAPMSGHFTAFPDPHITGRSQSMHLPRWQPDSDIRQCPICETEFTFWYRKHHCRKCGRVVCSACSPHRITIPRQYVVQPPNPYQGLEDEDEDEHDNEDENPSSLPHPIATPGAGGSEVVRVCNPCVPDPWMPPNTNDIRPASVTYDPGSNAQRAPGAESAQTVVQHLTNAFSPLPERSESAYRRYRPISRQHGDPVTDGNQVERPDVPGSMQRPVQGLPVRFTRPSARYVTHRHTHSTGNSLLPAPSPHAVRRSSIPIPHSTSLPTSVPFVAPTPPRRQIREEDECPVCGNEMPPGERIREAHIEECIANRFSSTPTRQSSRPENIVTNAGPPQSPAQSSIPGSVPSASAPLRARASSYRPRGMAIYRATEKDCIGEDGDALECVICFEEFQSGDELGRMECLCKFHRVCIRQWWDTKGVGSCPTHQLHE